MIDWPQLMLQMAATLVPVAIALINQNRKIAKLEVENEELRRDNTQLAQRLTELTHAHGELQGRYEATLRSQAGLRDRF